jgi:hypothetical protein
MNVPAIVKVTFTGEDRVWDVIRNVNADGFGSLYPEYKGGRPPEFTLARPRAIKKIAKAKTRHRSPLRSRQYESVFHFVDNHDLTRRGDGGSAPLGG